MSNRAGSNGHGQRTKYAPLLDTDDVDHVESPIQQAHSPITPRTARSLSHSRARRSLSRLGATRTTNGSVLELHFASVEQKRVRWWRDAAITSLFIAAWFFFATVLSVYNKWMFSPQYLAFPYPLFVTTLHMVVQFILASLVRWLWPATFKPDRNPTKEDYVKKAFPTAVTTSLDIGLSNLSLKLITLSFYTMCKSSSLIFVLLFAFILHLERPSVRLIGVIALITSGVLMMVFTTTTFSLTGLVMVISASFFGGLRWSLTQLLLKKKDMGMNNPAATIFWLAPSMALSLAVTSMLVEGWINVWNNPFWERIGVVWSLIYLLSPGSIAFAMVMSEYYIITRAGVVPMSIAGIFKEVTTLVVSASVFGDHLTELNIIGVAITIGGIALYTYHKYTAALHSAVPLDAHGNPLEEEDAEEVLAVVRTDTLNEEGLRLLEDGGEIAVPLDEDDEEDEESRRILENAAEGGHGDGEIGNGRHKPEDDRPLFTVGDDEFDATPVIAGSREEGAHEVAGVGRGVDTR
ncbi:hypothetical protein M408DRAFT_329860 [Serendipita vermifera MAFF 305830]|uniref:Sugar phosphate transporter domain-containing protein n=1 Tax=Serendipita vermifera MAFF 305830 TaxID=933852 RepID=A0A0C3B892_SERVB|nr:hypothetical protein M408DRAFT_329860 [Serendipita vermifera MAFF 305830]